MTKLITLCSACLLACATTQTVPSPSAHLPGSPPFDAPQLEAAAVVRAFAVAGDAQDVGALQSVLHPQFRVVFTVVGTQSATLLDLASYMGGIRGGTMGGSPRTLTIEHVTVRGALARVQAQLQGAAGHFNSDFVLARNDGRWTVLSDATLFAPGATQ